VLGEPVEELQPADVLEGRLAGLEAPPRLGPRAVVDGGEHLCMPVDGPGCLFAEELRQIGLVDDPVRVSEHAQARERTEHAAERVRIGTRRGRQLLCGPRALVHEVGDSQPGTVASAWVTTKPLRRTSMRSRAARVRRAAPAS